jgi:hypothetical protein
MILQKLGQIGFICVVLMGVYTTSFLLLEKPCKHINKCPVSKEYYDSPDYKPYKIYPSVTATCISENRYINVAGYYFYWPIHTFVKARGAWYFVKDPTPEAW